jgi:acyl dehydratase
LGLRQPDRVVPPRFDAELRLGDVYLHQIGKTVGESEHMQLTALCRNTHPLHFDELYCKDHSFQKTRVVYGGLVFGWIYALASRDVGAAALWELGFDEGAHPGPVLAGDTLYAATQILSVDKSEAKVRLVGVKNITSEAAYAQYGDALFQPELSKKEDKVKEKVFEITRTILVRS